MDGMGYHFYIFKNAWRTFFPQSPMHDLCLVPYSDPSACSQSLPKIPEGSQEQLQMDMGLRAEKKCPTNQQIFTRHLLGARSSVGAEVGGQPLLQGDQSLGQGASTGC